MDFYFDRRIIFILKIKLISNTSSYLEAVGECSAARVTAAWAVPGSRAEAQEPWMGWAKLGSPRVPCINGAEPGPGSTQAGAAADEARAGLDTRPQQKCKVHPGDRARAGLVARLMAQLRRGLDGAEVKPRAPGQRAQPWGRLFRGHELCLGPW